MVNKKIAIIGLGLIGGALAKAFKQKLKIKDILGIDRCQETINLALNEGVISYGFAEINSNLSSCDFVFICTPVKEIPATLDLVAANTGPGSIITDVGSTKTDILSYANKMYPSMCFIGGHPMAGTEKNGYSHSFPHLFENAYYVLTPSNSIQACSVDMLAELIEGIGAIPIIMDAGEHDKIASGISHVPHLIAAALVNLVKKMDGPSKGKVQLLAAGGFKDITRIASSNPKIWENIVVSNKKEVEKVLEEYIDMLVEIKSQVNAGDSEYIYDFFDTARDFRSRFSSTNKGLIAPMYDIIVDIEDIPGIIGKIATLLGSSGINIKNINVSNSREFEQGCLRISLPDSESAVKSVDMLNSNGYKAFTEK